MVHLREEPTHSGPTKTGLVPFGKSFIGPHIHSQLFHICNIFSIQNENVVT